MLSFAKLLICGGLVAMMTSPALAHGEIEELEDTLDEMQEEIDELEAILRGVTSGQLFTRQACERQRLHISCGDGEVITVVDANYGRTAGSSVCSGPVRTTVCSAPQSQRILRASCENQRSCTVSASNGVFGDPCVGTFKYLWVQYRCIEEW